MNRITLGLGCWYSIDMSKLAAIGLQYLGLELLTKRLVSLGPMVKPDVGNLLSPLYRQHCMSISSHHDVLHNFSLKNFVLLIMHSNH